MKDNELYQEENRKLLINLNKAVGELKPLLERQIGQYTPIPDEVQVKGKVELTNPIKNIEIDNFREVTESIELLQATLEKAIKENAYRPKEEIRVKNLDELKLDKVSITNLQDLKSYFEDVRKAIENNQPIVNIEKQEFRFPTGAKEAIPVRLSDGKSFYNALISAVSGPKITQIVDSSGNAVTVTDNKLDVNASVNVGDINANTEYTEGATDSTLTGIVSMAEGPSDTVTPLQVDASKHLQVDIAADSVGIGGGIQYTEGDTDATITGTAALWEDTSNTLRAVSATYPLPISDAGGSLTIDGTVTANAGTGNFNVNLQDGAGTDINSTSNALHVHVKANDVASGGTSSADDADFTAGTTSGTPSMGVYESSPTSVTDGDMGIVGITSGRRLKTSTTIDAALPAGTNNIGDVDVLSSALPTGASTSANQTTIIGHLDGVEGLLTTIDTDTSNISTKIDTLAGAVSGTEMQVDVLTMPTTTVTATNLDIRDIDKASDDITIYSNTVKDGSGTAYVPLVDTDGHLQVDVLSGGGGGTQYTEADTDASITGTAIMWEDTSDTLRAVSASKPLPVDIQDSTIAVTQSGTWNINNVSGTVSLPTGASTAANQTTIIGHLDGVEGLLTTIDTDTGNIDSSLNNIEAGYATEGSALGSGVLLQGDDGTDRKNINVDATTGDVQVDVTNTVTVSATQLDIDSLNKNDDEVLVWANTAKDGTGTDYVPLVDTDGHLQVDVLSGGGSGTEYTVNDAAPANPLGTTTVMERDDALTTLTEVEGDWTNMRATAEGALWTQDFNSDSILTNTTTIAGAVSGSEMQVDVVTSALPTGAATSANQTTIIGHVDGIEGLLTTIDTDTGNIATDTSTIATNTTAINTSTGATTDAAATAGSTGTVQAKLRLATSQLDSIKTAVETIDNAISGSEMQVDIVGSLPAGTNAIGKLSANSGVDIGDVDVTSITPGTTASALGKAEDAGHSSGDVGVMSLGVRQDTPNAALSGTDADYTPISVTSTGAIRNAPISEDFAALANGPQVKKYYTSAGSVTDGIVWSPAAGKRWYITDIFINVSAAATVTLEDDKAGGDEVVWKAELAANSGWSHSFETPLFSGEDAADLIVTTNAGNVYITVTGYEI